MPPQLPRPPNTRHCLPSAPKATPGNTTTDSHFRVLHNRVDATGTVNLPHAGRLHHIGIGRTHARTPVIMLVADLDVRVVHAATGELLRAFTIDPTRDYQPTGTPRSQKRRNPRT